jgi:hypothetical protein
MKTTLFIILSAFLLTNCNSRQTYKQVVSRNNDTLLIDTSLQKVNRIFNNPFRDINNFDIKIGNDFFDSLHNEYSNSKITEIALTKDICIGDLCESYQTIINKDNNTVLYFFKGDGGEYGFSNDQYFLTNDSLNFVRNYNVSIETWPTDSTETIWRVEEIIYKFQIQAVSCIKKTVLTKELDRFDFTLKNATSEIIKVGWKGTYQNKAEELKKLLERKNSKDLDQENKNYR